MQLDISISKKDFINTFLLVVLYTAALYGIQFFLHSVGFFGSVPSDVNLVRWDAGWYRSIGEKGYSFSSSNQSNSGFYFLYGFVWKLTQANGIGISVINMLFFAVGFSILSDMFKLNTQNKLLWLSVPTVFFAFVPYSESLFFLLSSLCLLGIKKENVWLIWISLFLLSLTRATALFVIPVFFCMELIGNSPNKWLKSLLRYFVLYVLPSVAGTLTFVLIQYWQTHVWFAYFITQSAQWKRIYGLPIFPLTNSCGNFTMWLNALAIFFCFVAFSFLVIMIVQWLFKKKQWDKILVVSIGYLSMTLFTAIFYSPKWIKGTTDVIGTFRYAMMNPFFYVFLYYFTHEIQYKLKHYLLIILLASAFWMAFGAYIHIDYFLFFTTNTIMIILYMLSSNKKIEWPTAVMIALNILLQVHLFQLFLSGISIVD